LECVPNVAEGRDAEHLRAFAEACGSSLLDLHTDIDHHRTVLTLAGPTADGAEHAVRRLARAVAGCVDIAEHRGVHPRLGALDVVPFVAFDGSTREEATAAALSFGQWFADTLGVPVFLYDDADPHHRTLPDTRRDAFVTRAADFGPAVPHSRLGVVAVGARPVLVAVNCELDRDDLPLAREIAHQIRARDGGLPGVRALGLALPSVRCAQVSMNLVALDETGVQETCELVRTHARAAGSDVARVELVGLVPAAELDRCDADFLEWSGLGPEQTIEWRLARAGGAGS